MQYIALLLAFLCEITIRPAYIVSTITVETITIVYFITLLRTKKNITVLLPALLICVANFITGKVLGLQSTLLMFVIFIYHHIFVNHQRRLQKTLHAKQKFSIKQSVSIFSFLFGIITVVKALILHLFGYNVLLTSEFFYFLLNTFIFMTLALCI
jgi:hypothetical protein